jgi:hypothetical protein
MGLAHPFANSVEGRTVGTVSVGLVLCRSQKNKKAKIKR